MRVSVLFSAGKDSVYVAYICQQHGWDVKELLTLVPKRDDSYMFHTPNIGMAGRVADALGLPHVAKETSGEKEAELADLYAILAESGAEAVVSGAILSDYQSARIEATCHNLGIRCFAPLWRKSQEALLREMVNAGFKIVIAGVFAQAFSKDWLGREIDAAAIKELCVMRDRYGINVCGEGGEMETFVLDGPNFKKRLSIKNADIEFGRDSGILRIKEIESIPKKPE